MERQPIYKVYQVCVRESVKLFASKTAIFSILTFLLILAGFSLLLHTYVQISEPESGLTKTNLAKKMQICIVSEKPPQDFLKILKNYFDRVYYIDDIQKALELYKTGQVSLVINVQNVSTSRLSNKKNITIYIHKSDITSAIMLNTIYKAIELEAKNIQYKKIAEIGLPSEPFIEPVRLVPSNFVHIESHIFPDFTYILLVPALLFFSSFSVYRIFLLSLREEIKSPFFTHILTAPISITEYISGKSLPYIALVFLQTSINLISVKILYVSELNNLILLSLISTVIFFFNISLTLFLTRFTNIIEKIDSIFIFIVFLEIFSVFSLNFSEIWTDIIILARYSSPEKIFILKLILITAVSTILYIRGIKKLETRLYTGNY